MIRLKNLLLENPDGVKLSPDFMKQHKINNNELEWDDSDSFVFGYIKGELFGVWATNHMEIPYEVNYDESNKIAQLLGYKNMSSIPWESRPRNRNSYTHAGRLWRDSKIISFWDYPSVGKLGSIIGDLKKKYKININKKTWYIEIIDKGGKYEAPDTKITDTGWKHWDAKDKDVKLVSLSKYIGSEKQKGKETQHAISPKLKKKFDVPVGVGSRKKVIGAKDNEVPAATKFRTRKGLGDGMIKMMDIINEGGWASSKTQKTIITPKLVAKTIPYVEKFIKDFNVITKKDDKPPIKFVSAVGSTKYWKQDLKNDPDKHYGDIDLLISFPVWYNQGKNARDNENKSLKYYFDKIVQLSGKIANLDSDSAKSGGKNLIFKIDGDYVQVDFVATTPEYEGWTKGRFTPEHGLKGFTVGGVFSALGNLLNLSMGDRGILAKMKQGVIVPTKMRKDVEIVRISKNFKTFIRDLTKFIVGYIDPKMKTYKEHPELKKFKGLNPDNIQLANFCKGVVGMAKTLELNGIFEKGNVGGAKNANDFLKKVRDEYKKVMVGQVSGSKFKKADTPEAYQAIEKVKKHAKEGINIINKYLK